TAGRSTNATGTDAGPKSCPTGALPSRAESMVIAWLLVNSPYTAQPGDAVMAAQTGVGLVLGALVWGRRVRPWPAAALLLGAICLAVMMPVEGDFLRGLGMTLAPE